MSHPQLDDAPIALAPTDPAPDPAPTKADPFAAPAVRREATPTGLAAEAKAEPVKPDLDLAALVATARATCGCDGCRRFERKSLAVPHQTRGGGSCVAREVFAELARRQS